ncbi:hypothetical protein CEXT_142831 [Caerostris extrusa]|uniref:P/Homo B domain-containing protein n=1 Tax=Caerostris extrusa TaxID=172846 RepID=A0AAV4UJS3_CAEEX|nr:hypothetical protein CEXT_142831 [Caerostris extrusa]
MIRQVPHIQSISLNSQKTMDKNGVITSGSPTTDIGTVFFPTENGNSLPHPYSTHHQTIFNGPHNGLWHIKITRQNGPLKIKGSEKFHEVKCGLKPEPPISIVFLLPQ